MKCSVTGDNLFVLVGWHVIDKYGNHTHTHLFIGVALRSQRPRLVGRPAGRHSDVVSSVRTYTTDQSDGM
jgi:hypothetical protein